MLLSYTSVGNVTAGKLANSGGVSSGEAGIITDIEISSDDVSQDVSISDETGVIFAVTATNFSTAVKYKSDSASILRNQVTGPLTTTIASNTGTTIVRVWRAPVNR